MAKKKYALLLIRSLFGVIILGLALFLPAGTIFWWEAWVYLIIFVIFFIFYFCYFYKIDPELLEKRFEIKLKKRWDKIIMVFLGLSFTALFILPGFDAVRFEWFEIPIFIEIIGFIGMFLSLIIIFLVMRENTYLSRVIEIQKERGHKIITTGPYRIIRHPMYAGFSLYCLFHCLALGSLYSFIAAGFTLICLIIRTIFEDKMLHRQLEGYDEYAQKTKYKLIPGIW
jgi:protein-S-isoprenylcysteine O-methyltransferase Ste14